MRLFSRVTAVLTTLTFVLTGLAVPAAHADDFDIAIENQYPGTPHWRLRPSQFTRQTEAFVSQSSAQAGDQVGLYVSCRSKTFTAGAYRLGYYNGIGARRIWQTTGENCVHQTATNRVSSTRYAAADWKRSLTFDTTEWPEGIYLIKVVSSDGSGTYVNFIVRPHSTADRLVFVSATMTFQAYNMWGGASAYRGSGGFATRAKVLAFDRPQSKTLGASKFLSYEYPIVREAEKLGIPVSYLADTDIAADPGVIDGATALAFGGHAEYWTQSERDAVIAARKKGTHVLFFGANTAYWRVRLVDSPLGANRTMVIYKSTADPDKQHPTVLFRSTGQAESALTGGAYNCFPANGTFVVSRADHWVFDGTGASNGSGYSDIIGPEIDSAVAGNRGVSILANSPSTCGQRKTVSTFSIMTAANGAMTINVGSMGWTLRGFNKSAPQRTRDFVTQVTDNILLLASSE